VDVVFEGNEALSTAALPLIESKMEATLLSNDVVVELQRLYNKPVAVTDWMILGSFPNPCPEPFPAEPLKVHDPPAGLY